MDNISTIDSQKRFVETSKRCDWENEEQVRMLTILKKSQESMNEQMFQFWRDSGLLGEIEKNTKSLYLLKVSNGLLYPAMSKGLQIRTV